MTYAGAPAWTYHGARRRSRGPARSGPPQLTIADDAGSAALADFSGGGNEDRGWRGRWATRQPLSPSTAWLDVEGTRIALVGKASPMTARVEPLPEQPLVHRYLWHRLAATEPRFRHEHVTQVLVELRLVDAEDPELGTIAEVAAALPDWLYQLDPSQPSPRSLPSPWAALLGGGDRHPGPRRAVPIAALTPQVDGTVVVMSGLESDQRGFIVRARAIGPGADMQHAFGDGLPGVPLAWWAEDDRGNWYLAHWGSRGGHQGDISGELNFHPPLDPAATSLRLLPTGLHHRAVIEVPLAGVAL